MQNAPKDIEKFYLTVDENTLVMRNADNQIILPIKELSAVQMRTLTNGSVSVAFLTSKKTLLGFIEDAATADDLAKVLRSYAVHCSYYATDLINGFALKAGALLLLRYNCFWGNTNKSVL